MKKADIIGGLIGILIGLYAIWEGSNMPEDVVMKIGPSFFPTILASLLIIFSLVLIVNALRGKSKGEVTPLKLSDKGVQRGLITLVAAIVFCIALDPIGFIPTAIVFLACMMWVMGNRKPMLMIVVPPLITLSIWLIFEKVLNLSMPAGLLIDIL
ncbi:tripartite tricarboxylate transporter TctB family protein [Propionivibrio dicarboxylicus]|uniref:Putative tricarboxylic transport membrane protein n=1 Tax=Propionivibrio dicarboxylicus TaxID=83767 RepID=A0A1G7XLT3_9RHOO|nr:tripartite tricarboxylate transporter TctB family protein [Propionivibrio dicarboxylicus]SDG85155.1 putative tricarboxylic transport membrane protein [Propionivibrio dicarboxylicus]